MKQRDIVWVRIPFSDLSRQKARPALVVSNDAYNAKQEDVVVCALTSNKKAGEYRIPVGPGDLESGALPVQSAVRADKILHVEKALIERSFARVTRGCHAVVVERLAALVGVPSAGQRAARGSTRRKRR